MIYKEDWDKSKERYRAFWQGAVIDRCCCAVTAPRDTSLPSPQRREARDLNQQWLDPGFRLEQELGVFAHTYYGGDAFPLFWNNLGPGVAAAFMGAAIRLASETVWFDADPPIKDWKNRREIELDTAAPMWKAAWDLTEHFCKNAQGRYIVGITDLGGSLDIAASLRGSDRLLYDLYDEPEQVKRLVQEIDAAWKPAYDLLQGLIEQYDAGNGAWMGMWSPGRWYPLQCDFSAMISRQMFDEFVKPALAAEAEWFDNAIYHLDGPGEICHLESILEIQKIDGVQCVPGTMFQERTGTYYQSFANPLWMPVMKKIQKQKRLLVLNEVKPIELEELMENLSPEGLFLSITCGTEEEAGETLKRIERWK